MALRLTSASRPAPAPASGSGRVRRLRRWLPAAIVAVALPLAGCAANFGAQTNQIYQPAQGIADRHGDVWAIDTLVVADNNGNGTLVAALINTVKPTDELVGLQATMSTGEHITVTPGSLHVKLKSHQPVQFANTGKIRLQGSALKPGGLIDLRFTFANAAPISFEVPVMADTKEFSQVPVG